MVRLLNIDTWDSHIFPNPGTSRYYNIPEVEVDITTYEYNSRVFNEQIVDSPSGSIIDPTKTVKFFRTTAVKHTLWRHTPSNLTSVKKAIRAVMPSVAITTQHFLLLYGNYYNEFFEYLRSDYWSSVVSLDINYTWEQLYEYAIPEITDTDVIIAYYELLDFWVVLREELFPDD